MYTPVTHVVTVPMPLTKIHLTRIAWTII